MNKKLKNVLKHEITPAFVTVELYMHPVVEHLNVVCSYILVVMFVSGKKKCISIYPDDSSVDVLKSS